MCVRGTWAQIPANPFGCCVTSGNLHNLSDFHFSQLLSAHDNVYPVTGRTEATSYRKCLPFSHTPPDSPTPHHILSP